MASQSKHLVQWKHNRKLIALIDREFPDWIVTVAFYAALQIVDALLECEGNFPTNHETRNLILMKTNRYKKINQHFLPLYNLSRTVRYMADHSKWIPADRIEVDVLGRNLYPIENSALKLMDLGDEVPSPISLKPAK